MGPFIYELFKDKKLLIPLIKNTIIYVNVSDSFKENYEKHSHHSHQKLSSCLLDKCLKYYYYINIDPTHAECSQIYV